VCLCNAEEMIASGDSRQGTMCEWVDGDHEGGLRGSSNASRVCGECENAERTEVIEILMQMLMLMWR
jgi:hypothetical protein